MTPDHNRLGLENKFLEDKLGRFFAFDKLTLPNFANKSGGMQTNLLYFLYNTSEVKQYYLSYGQNALFQNVSRQLAL